MLGNINNKSILNNKQKYLTHLNKIIRYSIYNKNIQIFKMFYACHSDNDIIIQFKIYNTGNMINYVIKLNSNISITNQITNLQYNTNNQYVI